MLHDTFEKAFFFVDLCVSHKNSLVKFNSLCHLVSSYHANMKSLENLDIKLFTVLESLKKVRPLPQAQKKRKKKKSNAVDTTIFTIDFTPVELASYY